MDLPNNSFDMVFCFATMVHVPDIGKGFSEMARVTKPGGVLYSVAAPLWNSPYGHHKPELFQPRYPWIHLLLDREAICELCEKEGIVPTDDLMTALCGCVIHTSSFQLNCRNANRLKKHCGKVKFITGIYSGIIPFRCWCMNSEA